MANAGEFFAGFYSDAAGKTLYVDNDVLTTLALAGLKMPVPGASKFFLNALFDSGRQVVITSNVKNEAIVDPFNFPKDKLLDEWMRENSSRIREVSTSIVSGPDKGECQTARKVAPRSASNVDPLSMLRGEEAARRSWSGLRSRAGSGSVVCGELRACS
ncbi:hypothetical protein [Bosea sp. TAB14]|uniref:hypothetical protein n=1 Tax=Bosea sp. TAB14 TaxID=3237481 RepID=UPI003F8F8C4E